MLYCKKCHRLINGSRYQIEDCWCGGHLISNYLRQRIFDYNKNFHKINKEMNQESIQEKINIYIVNWIYEEEGISFHVYLIMDKRLRRPKKFLLDIVKEVLECAPSV